MDAGLEQSIPFPIINDGEEFLRFCEMVPQAVFIVINGGVVYCNGSGAKLMGFVNYIEMKGRCIKEFIHSDFLEDYKKLATVLKDKDEESAAIEIKLVNNKGIIIDAEVSTSTFIRKGNQITYIIVKDITEANRIKKGLKESQEKYKTLVEMLPDAICLRNREGLLYANMAATHVLGYERPEEVVGRDITEFITPYPQGRLNIVEFERELLERGSIPFREIDYIRKSDGRILMTETAVKSIPNQEEPIYLVVARDISGRKDAEELKIKMEEKTKKLNEAVEYDKLRTEFFANISHEFRTPLNVILSALQLTKVVLKDSPASECKDKVTKYINLMQQNCYRLIKLVNNLIDITKIDTGFFNIMPEECNIVSIVEDITLSVKKYIENKGVSLTFDTDEEEIILFCDPEKIERIMLNLLSNALKFTNSPGSITVSVRKADEKVLVSVKDTGIGILEDKKSIIFDRFRQVDKSLSRNHEGSGIGLSLVKSLVEMHGGSIRLKSIFKEGSEFIIELPINNYLDKIIADKRAFFHTSNMEKISIEFSDIYF